MPAGGPREHKKRAREDAGQAMLMVVALITVAATVPAVVMATSVGQLTGTRENLNWAGAYAAAEAGVNDYIQSLDAAGNFTEWTAGRNTCPASTTNADDAAFCGWVALYDQTSPDEWYEYALPSTNGGGLTLTVSGMAGTGASAVVRTFKYRIIPENTFLDDIYWTQYEMTDPRLGGTCAAQYYVSSSSPNQSCWIQFDSEDTLDGPVFSNDTFRLCGSPTFNGPVYSAAGTRGKPLDVAGEGCGTPTPGGAGWGTGPNNVGNEPLPTTVAEASAASYVGCYIAGTSATSPASNVQMTLAQSGSTTKITWTGGTVYDQTANPNCTSPITASSLTSSLIYVFGNVTIAAGSTDTGFMTIVAGATDSSGDPATAYPGAGVMTLNGSVTYPAADIASSGYYDVDNSDALGLIGDYAIQMETSGGQEPCPTGGMQVDAALLALQDSFYNPNWSTGNICALYVVGSIAQDFRGAVGALDDAGNVVDGYEKHYTWDQSLGTYWPPYYLSPTSATWAPASYEECQAGTVHAALATPSC
ncbi:MAG TPA: hypothetical protein VME20_05045 [Acidimicrobiales bacterium]|nr:hypothetical protein [Acidimicrobiales bacterium]